MFCYICNREFDDNKIFKIHMTIHMNELQTESDMLNIDNIYDLEDKNDTFEELYNEFNKLYTYNYIYICPQCNKQFRDSLLLFKHALIMHKLHLKF